MKPFVWIWAILALVVIGCGGNGDPGSGGTTGRGQVFGALFNKDGASVANARVWTTTIVSRETTSNSTGAYLLQDVAGSDIIVQAEVYRGGQRYYGQNLATISAGQRQSGINITMFQDNQLGQIRGVVMDTSGNLLRGVRIFAKPTAATFGTSTVAVSDARGNYVMNGLGAGINYQLQANGLGYNSATTVVSLGAGETRGLDITVPTGVIYPIAAPTNISAQAWTMPKNLTRDKQTSDAYRAIKQYLNPKATRIKASTSRETPFGNLVEVDVYWDAKLETHKLGFGIYRSTNGGSFTDVAFLRDPLADFMVYSGPDLTSNVNYTFGVTAIDTLFDGVDGESAMSDTVTVNPLDDLRSVSVSGGANPTFNWTAAGGAATYQVFVYSELPTIGVTPLATSPAVTGTTWTMAGGVTSGRTYWYVVIGSNTFGDKTVSQISTFVP